MICRENADPLSYHICLWKNKLPCFITKNKRKPNIQIRPVHAPSPWHLCDLGWHGSDIRLPLRLLSFRRFPINWVCNSQLRTYKCSGWHQLLSNIIIVVTNCNLDNSWWPQWSNGLLRCHFIQWCRLLSLIQIVWSVLIKVILFWHCWCVCVHRTHIRNKSRGRA